MNNEINSDVSISELIRQKLADMPVNPGVYQYLNKNGKIIYVGKAKNLRNRVRSYFHKARPVDAKTKVLVKKIHDIEVIVTDSEAEALILEDNLIKKYKPRYNIMLKDDKSYPFIRVTNEPYPRIFATRKIVKDGSMYFGPYTEVKNMKQLLRTVRTMFRIRSCNLNIDEESIKNKKHKVCLDYHIDKCDGPCEGLISYIKYNRNVKQAIEIINGKTKGLEKQLEEEMNRLSEEMKFEEAAVIRNRYLYLKEYTSRQKVVSTDLIDRDVFGLARIDNAACSLVFKIRDGKLIGKRHFIIPKAEGLADEKIIQTTIEKWYLESEFIPREIHLPVMPEQDDFIKDWLIEKRGGSVDISVPKIGDKKKFVNMAATNAEFLLREYFLALAKREQTVTRPVQALQRDLKLAKPPVRIECFDNSHIQGSELVSSLVVFENGRPKKSDYRKFKIKTVGKNDDFAAMREAVGRRYSKLLEEKADLPDLIIIDGGKGQLSGAYRVLKDLGIENNVTIIGLAKRLEEVFFPGIKDSLLLPKTSSALKLIQQVRDEAHRFAITFHRQLREKRTLKTELTSIKGIGKITANKLLVEFGSVENIRNAGFEELSKAAGEKTAKAITDYFSDGNDEDIAE